MGGFHPLDLLVIIGIGLLLFGPKTLQSISRNAGKGMGQVKDMKQKMLEDLPLEDLARVTDTVSKFPLSPQQAAKRLVASALLPADEKTEGEVGEAVQE